MQQPQVTDILKQHTKAISTADCLAELLLHLQIKKWSTSRPKVHKPVIFKGTFNFVRLIKGNSFFTKYCPKFR